MKLTIINEKMKELDKLLKKEKKLKEQINKIIFELKPYMHQTHNITSVDTGTWSLTAQDRTYTRRVLKLRDKTNPKSTGFDFSIR